MRLAAGAAFSGPGYAGKRKMRGNNPVEGVQSRAMPQGEQSGGGLRQRRSRGEADQTFEKCAHSPAEFARAGAQQKFPADVVGAVRGGQHGADQLFPQGGGRGQRAQREERRQHTAVEIVARGGQADAQPDQRRAFPGGRKPVCLSGESADGVDGAAGALLDPVAAGVIVRQGGPAESAAGGSPKKSRKGGGSLRVPGAAAGKGAGETGIPEPRLLRRKESAAQRQSIGGEKGRVAALDSEAGQLFCRKLRAEGQGRAAPCGALEGKSAPSTARLTVLL